MKFDLGCIIALLVALSGALPAHAADTNLGREIYQRHCISCHGANGNPVMAAAPDFGRGQGLMQSDLALRKRIEDGKFACPAFRGILDEQQILDVIAYIRTFF